MTHGLKFQARALAAQVAETSCSRWLVGTLALREENEARSPPPMAFLVPAACDPRKIRPKPRVVGGSAVA